MIGTGFASPGGTNRDVYMPAWPDSTLIHRLFGSVTHPGSLPTVTPGDADLEALKTGHGPSARADHRSGPTVASDPGALYSNRIILVEAADQVAAAPLRGGRR